MRLPKDMKAAQAELNGVSARYGALTPANVVRAAAEGHAPEINKCLEWDDSIAGPAYRLEQARRIVRYVVVKPAGSLEPRPVHYSVTTATGREYVPRRVAFRQYTGQVVVAGLRALEAWVRRYDGVPELKSVVEAVQAALAGE